ncbi:uncharacterized protein O3C94_014689 isoform 2-T2 [Discoglossus pictus]
MSKDKKNMEKVAERFLNQVLEVIYLLTGEAYTIVKKNSPHIHQQTGEVHIKCDDVAVYFSMEEWEYIEEHKELYKDVMMENHQTPRTLGIPANRSSVYEENVHPMSFSEEREDERDGQDNQQEGIQSEPCAGLQEGNVETASVCVDGEDETDGNDNEEIETHSDLDTSELYCKIINSNHSLQEGNLEIVSVCVDGEDETDGNDNEEIETHSDLDTDGGMTRNTVEASGLLEVIVEEGIDQFQTDQRTDSERNTSTDSYVYEKGNLASTSITCISEQIVCVKNEQFSINDSNLMCRTRSIKKEESANCAKPDKRTPVWGSIHPPHIEKVCNPKLLAVNHRTHIGHKSYICSDCGKSFTTKPSLVTHQKFHIGESLCVCQTCGKGFSKRSVLIAHSRTHTGERPHVCQICGKCFSAKITLVRHHRTHTGEKPHACQICGKSFTDKSGLNAHHRTHTGEKPHVCQRCGKCFSTKHNLIRHHIIHTGEKPHVCQICGKCFFFEQYLVRHQRIHTGEKPHVCQICGKRFPYKSNMNAHYRTHTGEKPHVCQICGKIFSDKSNLNAHHRTHSGEGQVFARSGAKNSLKI